MVKILAKNKKVQKLISSLVIITMLTPAIFLSFQPRKAEALLVNPLGVPVNDFVVQIQKWKEILKEIWKAAMMVLARQLINKVTRATIDWINSGFHGAPLYIENPKSFFKDIAKYEVETLVTMFGYDSLKFPFGKEFAQNTINSYQRKLDDNASYTLSKVIDDPVLLESYRKDFNVGGWGGFLINTQYPQNNYVGFQMEATDELRRRLEGTVFNSAQRVQDTLQKGMGFLSPQVCPTNPAYNNLLNQFNRPSFESTTPYSPPEREDYASDDEWGVAMLNYEAQYSEFEEAERATWAEINTCPGGLVDTTPGSVIANQIMNATSTKFRQSELAAAMGNALSAVFDALLAKLMRDGLNKLGGYQDSANTEEFDYGDIKPGGGSDSDYTGPRYNQGTFDTPPPGSSWAEGLNEIPSSSAPYFGGIDENGEIMLYIITEDGTRVDVDDYAQYFGTPPSDDSSSGDTGSSGNTCANPGSAECEGL